MSNRFTVAAKFNGVVIVLTIAAASLVSYLLVEREYHFLHDQVMNDTLSLIHNSSDQQKAAIFYNDTAVSQRLAEEVAAIQAIDYVFIYDRRGELLVDSYDRLVEKSELPSFQDVRISARPITESRYNYRNATTGQKFADIVIPLFSSVNPTQKDIDRKLFYDLEARARIGGSQHLMGYVRVGINITQLQVIVTPFASFVLTGAALFILCGTLLSMLVTRRITAPLSQLAQMAQEISLGQLDQMLHVKGSGEVREIASMLNLIVRSLSSHKVKLDVEHRLLSLKVDERTTQLTASNRQLKQAVNDANKAKNRLRQLAYFDSLTVLPNRQLFTEQLGLMLRVAKREEHRLALLFIDLDNFKRINDSLGHSAGDILLKEVASRLRQCFRESDVISRYIDPSSEIGVARLGGDEFTVVLNRIDNDEAAGVVAKRLIAALVKPVMLDDHELVITPSIGIAIAPQHSDNVDGLLRHADTAMYHAKKTGKNNYKYYSSHMNEMGVQRLKLETELRRAVEKNELVLHYQPQVNILTGEIVGAEALVRWQHPEHGFIPPLNFIPLAEEMGLIVDIGEWVLTEACRQMQAWRENGLQLPKMAVNVSSLQFNHAWFIERIKQALKETRLDPHLLELELTESVIMNNADATIAALHEIKKLGVTLSVDDFGTGYSSLNYLNRFPLDELKIDKSFISDMDKDKYNAGLVVAIIAMARSLNLSLVAEGVETREQYNFLREQGIQVIQGFLFSKGLPVNEFEALLKDDPFGAKILSMTPREQLGQVVRIKGV